MEETQERGKAERGKAEHAAPTPAAPPPSVRPRRRRRGLRAFGWTLLAAFLLVAGLLAAVQAGFGDAALAGRVRAVLANTLGPDVTIDLRQASIRIGGDGRLAIEADGVRFLRPMGEGAEPGVMSDAEKVRLLLDPMPLLRGEMQVSSVDIEGVRLDAGLIGRDQAVDWAAMRIDALEGAAEAAFEGLDRVLRMLAGSRTRSIRLIDSMIVGIAGAPPEGVRVDRLELALDRQGALAIEGMLSMGDHTGAQRITLAGHTVADAAQGTIEEAHVTVSGIERFGTPDFHRTMGADDPDDVRGFGVDAASTLVLTARRDGSSAPERLEAALDVAAGSITLGGAVSELSPSRVALAYLPGRRTIEILPSVVNVGTSTLPFSGGAIDLSNLTAATGQGFGMEAIIRGARAAPADSSEPSLVYDAKVSGRFLTPQQRVVLDRITVTSPLGDFYASAAFGFGESSPEISFAGSIDRMQTAGIKQLWPHWIAKRPREWVLRNVFGGTATNGAIRAFIPAGWLAAGPGNRPELTGDQLRIRVDLDQARVGLPGDIPPLRDARGSLDFAGSRLDVTIDGGTAYFPSGRTVDLESGRFTIAQTTRRPLMAELEASIAGGADAVAELISYRPIDALEKTGFLPEDLDGPLTADVTARFGLIPAQAPPPPEWTAALALDGVDLARPVEGWRLSNVVGSLDVDPDVARLQASADVDGVPFDLGIVRPIRPDADVAEERVITGTLSNQARAQFVPGLDAFVDGPVGVTVTRAGERLQRVELDLARARLTVPGVNWSKAPGIGARASLTAAMSDEGISIRDFQLSGEGFGASGRMEVAGGGLASARFETVRLSPGDDFAVSVARSGSGYEIDVDGRAIDLRSLIASVRANAAASGEGADSGAVPISVRADLARASGFNGEVLNGFQARYAGRGAAISSADLRGVTDSGAAVVLSLAASEGGREIAVNSGDAGAFARFADIYGRIQGGYVDLKLRQQEGGPYAGSLVMRDFAVINEAQLRQLVSARAAGSTRSLDEMTRGRINAETARFDRGFAHLELANGALRVANGAVRGPEIGTTFQGTVFDGAGNMAITGTFMPAYGLNSLFAEIPLFGAILGNGRDRGLFGITFRLAGPVSAPQLTVNPISAIAPGIFRQIFEF